MWVGDIEKPKVLTRQPWHWQWQWQFLTSHIKVNNSCLKTRLMDSKQTPMAYNECKEMGQFQEWDEQQG